MSLWPELPGCCVDDVRLTFQTFTSLSADAVAKYLPSEEIHSVWPLKVCSIVDDDTLHTCAVLSFEPDATLRPPSEIDTEEILSECPRKVLIALPLVKSQTLISPFDEPVTSIQLFDESVTADTDDPGGNCIVRD